MRRFFRLTVLLGILIGSITGFTPIVEASSTYSSTIPSYENANDRRLGKVTIDINDVEALTSPDSITVVLPSGVTVNTFVPGGAVSSSGSVTVTAPATLNGYTNPLAGSGAFTTQMTTNNSFDIIVNPSCFSTGEGVGTAGVLVVDFHSMDVYGQSGDIVASFIASSGSGFTDGEVTIARVKQVGTTAMAWSVKTVSPGVGKNIYDTDINGNPVLSFLIVEKEGGSLQVNNSDPTTYNTIKLTLPEGVTWNEATSSLGGWAAAGTDYFVIDNFNGRDAYVTVNTATTSSAGRIGIFPVLNIDEDVVGEITLIISGDNPGISAETLVIANVAGIEIQPDSTTFEATKNSDGITTVTIKPSVNGTKYITATVRLAETHEGNETLVFSHSRSGVQQNVVALVKDYGTQSSGQAGFDVQPGDVIQVYLVDSLTSDLDKNPIMLQN